MRALVREFHETNFDAITIRKTRFIDILRGMSRGGAYGFDETAYKQFYPLALAAGLPLLPGDFESARVKGYRFFTVNPYVILAELRELMAAI